MAVTSGGDSISGSPATRCQANGSSKRWATNRRGRGNSHRGTDRRPAASAAAFDFRVHPARHHQEEHAVVGSQRVERVFERGRLVVLDKKMRVPGEGVAEQRDGDQEPEVDGKGE